MFFFSLFFLPSNNYLQIDYAYGTRTANTITTPGTTATTITTIVAPHNGNASHDDGPSIGGILFIYLLAFDNGHHHTPCHHSHHYSQPRRQPLPLNRGISLVFDDDTTTTPITISPHNATTATCSIGRFFCS